MASEQLFHIGVKGLIQNTDGQFLLLKANVSNHSKNTQPYWDIPGGRIQDGGNAVDTLKREIAEEIGVTDVSEIMFFTSVISNHKIPIPNIGTVSLALMIYKVSVPKNVRIQLDPNEITDFEWVTAGVAAERLSNKYPKDFTDTLK